MKRRAQRLYVAEHLIGPFKGEILRDAGDELVIDGTAKAAKDRANSTLTSSGAPHRFGKTFDIVTYLRGDL